MKKTFAKDFHFYKLFLIFLLGSIIGSFYEELVFFIQTKTFTIRHDLLYGPFSTLYGYGTIIFLLILKPINKTNNFLKIFLFASIIGGVLEYLAGYLSELIFSIKFWDYSQDFLNINGRTTIIYALIWGLFATIFIRYLYPKISNLIEKIPYKIGNKICFILVILMSLNIFVSYTAFFRMLERNKGYLPKTNLGKIYDKIYNDEKMYQKYPILKSKIPKKY